MLQDKLLIDEQFLPAAKELISTAQKFIYIATFKAEIIAKPRGRGLRKFFDTLESRVQRGLDVRVIINRTNPRGSIPLSNFAATQELYKMNIPVRSLRNDRICHAKLLIVDGEAAIVGSHNLSASSCRRNFEVSYLTCDPFMVGQLIGAYEEVWNNAQKV